MKTVRTTDQLSSIGINKKDPAPKQEPLKVDPIIVLAQEMRDTTASHERMLNSSVEAINRIAEQFSVPVKVETPVSSKVTRWKFTCQYDHHDRLLSMIAEAQE